MTDPLQSREQVSVNQSLLHDITVRNNDHDRNINLISTFLHPETTALLRIYNLPSLCREAEIIRLCGIRLKLRYLRLESVYGSSGCYAQKMLRKLGIILRLLSEKKPPR